MENMLTFLSEKSDITDHSLSVVGLQFAIAQYSTDCIIHYNFNQLKIQDAWESKVTEDIQYQNGGSTQTWTAIIKVV